MNELHLMGDTNDLNTLPLKLFNILSINYPFLFQQKNFHFYVCRTLASGARRRGDPWLILGSFILFIVNKGVTT
jgi:hypothetical protein